MGRKSKPKELVETTVGQHLALSVAAHLARTQLVPDPLNVCDEERLVKSVDVIANALLRVTPLYTKDIRTGKSHQLSDVELQGARATNGAQNLLLSDGRILSSVAIKRADLRQAIAILKTVGMPDLAGVTNLQEEQPSAGQPPDRMVWLLAQLSEIEELLMSRLPPEQVERANSLAVAIARSAPHGRIANLAMRLMSAIQEARNGGDEKTVPLMLAGLRSAIEETGRNA